MQYPIYFNYQFIENKPVRKKGGWFDIPLPYDLYFEAGEIVKIVFDCQLGRLYHILASYYHPLVVKMVVKLAGDY